MVFPKQLQLFYQGIETAMRGAGFIAGKSGRHMKYPYTFTAKVVQFPIFHYMKHNWIWMYYPLAWAMSFYVFAKIHFMANSPENKKNWAETQKRIAEKEAHH